MASVLGRVGMHHTVPAAISGDSYGDSYGDDMLIIKVTICDVR